jgi:antitoxin component YwqK of YwqJK toxin-antitoxin module
MSYDADYFKTKFHKNGKIEQTRLTADQKIGEHLFLKGSLISFNENGKLRAARLFADHKIDGILCSGGRGWHFFYDNGKIEGTTLAAAADQRIGEILYAKNSHVGFYENGKVKLAFELATDQKIGGVLYAKDQGRNGLSFYENGKVKYGVIAANKNLGGIVYAEYTEIEFFENGKVKSGVLAKDHPKRWIQLQMKKGSRVEFDKNNRIIGEVAPPPPPPYPPPPQE